MLKNHPLGEVLEKEELTDKQLYTFAAECSSRGYGQVAKFDTDGKMAEALESVRSGDPARIATARAIAGKCVRKTALRGATPREMRVVRAIRAATKDNSLEAAKGAAQQSALAAMDPEEERLCQFSILSKVKED